MNPVAIIDNNPNLVGKTIEGVNVFYAREYISTHPLDRYIIASTKYENEIRRMLEDFGISQVRTVLFGEMAEAAFTNYEYLK